MKIRLTVLLENNSRRKPRYDEAYIRNLYQIILDSAIDSLSDDPSEKATVEKAEIVEE